jgi:hypothetical protein
LSHFNNISLKKLAGKNITLDLGKFVPKLNVTVRITLMDANITGLLDIGEVLPLQPLCSVEPTPAICAVADQNQTLRTALSLHKLGVDVLVSVEIIDDSTGDTKSSETIHAAIEIDKPTLNLDTTLGVSPDIFNYLQLANKNLSIVKDCVVGSINKLDVQSLSLDMDIYSIKVTTSAVGLRKEMDTVLIDVITMIVDAYRGTVPLILNHVIMTDKLAITGGINITTFINTLSGFYLPAITGNKLIECQAEISGRTPRPTPSPPAPPPTPPHTKFCHTSVDGADPLYSCAADICQDFTSPGTCQSQAAGAAACVWAPHTCGVVSCHTQVAHADPHYPQSKKYCNSLYTEGACDAQARGSSKCDWVKPPPCAKLLQDIEIQGPPIATIQRINSTSLCCDLCSCTAGCLAFTLNDSVCELKASREIGIVTGFVSGLLETVPTPPPPLPSVKARAAPSPPPSPAIEAGMTDAHYVCSYPALQCIMSAGNHHRTKASCEVSCRPALFLLQQPDTMAWLSSWQRTVQRFLQPLGLIF